MSYDVGDWVRIDIPDASDPDHRYHGKVSEIEEVLQDDLSGITSEPRDDFLYQVAFEAKNSAGCRSGITTSSVRSDWTL